MNAVSVNTSIAVIIPAYNEEASIGNVVRDIPSEWVQEVVVVSNASTDNTEKNASEAGATVLQEGRKGYGYACLKGISYLRELESPPNLVVFLDGDYSDYPEELPNLVRPILEEGMDMVIGSRVLGKREKGSLTPQQVFGNWLATTLIRWLYGIRFSDLGPFRAIKFDKLVELDMQDKTYGWTVEMQVKAAKNQFKCAEVAVNYRRRIGVSKVSGTVKGTILAGYKILWTIFKLL
ncbi:MAG: glycosyltransferase family 2 protein [Bacteroidota bacterium]